MLFLEAPGGKLLGFDGEKENIAYEVTSIVEVNHKPLRGTSGEEGEQQHCNTDESLLIPDPAILFCSQRSGQRQADHVPRLGIVLCRNVDVSCLCREPQA